MVSVPHPICPPPPPPALLALAGVQHAEWPALLLDPQDRALWWNPAFLELFPEHDGHIHVGEPYAENLRRFYRARLDAQGLAHIERFVADGVERHRRQTAPYEFLNRNRWLRVEVVPVPGAGRLRLWSPAARPRDGNMLAARIVETGTGMAEAELELIADGVSIRDAHGRILRANRRLAEMYGLASAQDALGRTFPDLLGQCWGQHPGAEEARQRWADSSRFTGAPFELPLPGDAWVRVREHRMHDGGTIGTHVDVTDLCRLRRSAEEARQRAEELAGLLVREIEERKRAEAQRLQVARLVSLGQMATGLAHELNQPLAVMSLAAENAAMGLERRGAEAIPEALTRMEAIVTAAMRARDVVDHLRRFGRGEEEAAPEPVDLAAVLEGALTLSGAAIRSSGIHLGIAVPEPAPWVLGRRIALEEVVLSLLLNARDAIEAAGRPGGVIRLSVAAEGKQVRIAVADNGGGFSPAALQHALEPFFTTRPPGQGTGLGLALAYSTVSAMDGRIELSNAAEGAMVQVLLPVLAMGEVGAPEDIPA
jgi:signal transduction histidine kinase